MLLTVGFIQAHESMCLVVKQDNSSDRRKLKWNIEMCFQIENNRLHLCFV